MERLRKATGLAINQQLTVLRSLARQLGFSISTEMLQYESGLDANRQSIRTLIRDARHGVYGRVLVMNGDRLARDAEVWRRLEKN